MGEGDGPVTALTPAEAQAFVPEMTITPGRAVQMAPMSPLMAKVLQEAAHSGRLCRDHARCQPSSSFNPMSPEESEPHRRVGKWAIGKKRDVESIAPFLISFQKVLRERRLKRAL